MKKYSGILCLGFLVFLFVISSCGEYETLEIQKKAKRSADSLFRVHKDSIRKLGHRKCDTFYHTYFDFVFDSIKDDQLRKAKELIKK